MFKLLKAFFEKIKKRLLGISQEDVFYICDMMKAQNIVDDSERAFLQDFMYARHEEMFMTLQNNLVLESAQ